MSHKLIRLTGAVMIVAGWLITGTHQALRGEIGKLLLVASGYLFARKGGSGGSWFRISPFTHYLLAGLILAGGIYLIGGGGGYDPFSTLNLIGALLLVIGSELLTHSPINQE